MGSPRQVGGGGVTGLLGVLFGEGCIVWAGKGDELLSALLEEWGCLNQTQTQLQSTNLSLGLPEPVSYLEH